MSGIAGFISNSCTKAELIRMGETISHRGPDETGYFFLNNMGLVSKQLNITDKSGGKQPAYSEDEKIVAAFDGRLFNLDQLKEELNAKGHNISNNSDGAVLPHMYEEYGMAMFERLSGQFAIAVYDIRTNRLVLARDRMGTAPLHFYCNNNELFFSSEIKAIFASGRVRRELSCEALLDVFTYWSPQYDRTAFKDVFSLLPGEFLVYEDGSITRERYYELRFKKPDGKPDFNTASEELEAILCEAIKRRLTGDAKEFTYLSGGLDSSLITSIIVNKFTSSVETFSIGFEDERLDESKYQKLVCDYLGIKHNSLSFSYSEIPDLIKTIVNHIEAPVLRAGPVPLFKLSQMVRNSNVKVVLSGEGSDELLGGYDIYKEEKIRDYLKKYPDSAFRRKLFRKIYGFLDNGLKYGSAGSLSYFYLHNNADDPFSSHYTRWRQFSFFERFFSESLKAAANELRYPDHHRALNLSFEHELRDWSAIQRSQYLEIHTFLFQFLLSLQGDRMAMANSVEVRCPFLDDQLVEYSMSMDDRFKIKALNEKYLLKKVAEKYLPPELVNRRKFPYRSLLDVRKIITSPYCAYILSEEALRRYNIFDPAKVLEFIKAAAEKGTLSERENMLLMGVLTTQILCDIFDVQL